MILNLYASRLRSCSLAAELLASTTTDASSRRLKTERDISRVDCVASSSGSKSKSPMMTSIISWLNVSVRAPLLTKWAINVLAWWTAALKNIVLCYAEQAKKYWCDLYTSVKNWALKTCMLFVRWRFAPGLALRPNFKQNRLEADSTALVLGSGSITSSPYCISWLRWKGAFKPFGISVKVTNLRKALCATQKLVKRLKVRGANSGIKRTFNSGNGC